MDTIEDRRKKRLIFLNKMYEITGGDERSMVTAEELGKQLGFTDQETEVTIQFLLGQHLITIFGADTIGITHYGVQQVEEALSHPNEPTQYFPPVNIITLGSLIFLGKSQNW